MRPPAWLSRVWLLVALASPMAAACNGPGSSGAGLPPTEPLYVANAMDGTLTVLDGASGRVLGSRVPAGGMPSQVVVGQEGRVLTLSLDRSGGTVWLVRPASAGTGGMVAPADGHAVPRAAGKPHWDTRRIDLEPGASATSLAGDGSDEALVAYSVPVQSGEPSRSGGAQCRLALVSLTDGAVQATYPLCTGRDVLTGVSLEHTPAGPVAYASVWSRSVAADGARLPAAARVDAIQMASGTLVSSVPLDGLPRPFRAGGSLSLGAGGSGRLLYVVMGWPGTRLGAWGEDEYGWEYGLSHSWRLVGLDPLTLDKVSRVDLTSALYGTVTVSRDGASAFGFDAPGATRTGTRLMQVDLSGRVTPTATPVADVPATGSVAVASGRVYVANPSKDEVWAFDPQLGRRVQSIRVGRMPVSVYAAGSM